ncbi:sulfatase-like hydrolase/transferase [Streptomyces sp. NPDC028722]|uniref:sulfatase-like hydrolase/transferase n=1 Tax=Streptomyces sp. NPDC028722 TaxID=3155016 RepID=UPI0033F33CAF
MHMSDRYDHTVLVSIDGLRGDALQAPSPGTAVLSQLALAGAEFTNVISAAPGSAVAHGALFTGQYPLHNGLYDEERGALRVPSLFTHARRHGRRTVLLTDSAAVLTPGRGFTREVDVHLVGQDDAFVDAVTAAESTMAWAHFGPVDSARTSGVESIEGFLTRRFAPFVEHLTERVGAAGRRLLLVVVAGHGARWDEPDGRPGALAQEVLQVPLIIAGDGITPGRHGRRIRTVDVVPTVLDLAGLPVAASGLLDGRSLASVVLGKEELDGDAPAVAGWYGPDRVGEAGYLDDLKVVRWSLPGAVQPESVRMERLDGYGVPRPAPEADGADVLAMLDDYRGALQEPGRVTVTEEMRAQLRSQGYSV